MSDINPSLVSSELTTIETFKDTTEKRGSKLTLNELNYISDKQLHAKGGSGEDLFPEFPVVIEFDVRNASDADDISNLHARYLKGGYSDIRECPVYDGYVVLVKALTPDNSIPTINMIGVHDENGVLFWNLSDKTKMIFNPDGTIAFEAVNGAGSMT